MISWDLVFGTVTPTGSATVAILDTGIDATHPDLAGNVIPGTSILDGSNGLTDPSGHGTWMAGIIAARTNTEGIAGVGYAGVRVMPVTVLDANGLGQDSDVIAGVIWAADHGTDVILMAFSNPGFSDNLQDAIDYAWSKGAVLVAAVGNDAGSTPTFPAGDREVIGVSTTDATDQFAAFSNDGQAVFLAAPGTDIETTNIGGTYGVLSGTSASAAIVAGSAAPVKAVDPTLINGVIVGRLARTADPAGTQEQTGNGRINLARALEDTGTDFIEPTGAAPVGGGGPFVGPYVAAASNLQSVSVSQAASPTLTYGTGGTVTDTATVTRNGNGSLDVTLSATGVPAGVTVSTFSPNPVSFTGNTPTLKTSTFTVTTSNTTPVGTTFTVSAAGDTTKTTTVTIVIAKANQTITFAALAGKTYGDADFGVSATASSGLTVSFSSQTAGMCTVSGTTVHLVAAGTCTIRASQAGDSNYNTAPNVDRSFTIAQASSITTVSCPASVTYTGAAQTPCSATVTGAGGLSLTPTPSYTNNVNAGTASASYTYAGDVNHAGSSDSKTFTIDQATQAISFAPLADKYFGDANFTVSATGGASGQPVTFTAAGSCTVTGSTVHITGVGSCTITAHQAGNANYSAAPDVPQSFTITDNTPPDTSVDSGPTSPTNATTASFTFSGTDNVTPPGSLTFECQLDSGGFSACTSSKTYTSLADGPHTFEVRAKDAAGNVDPTAASFTWTVDTLAPDTLVDTHPADPTNSNTATFTFHASEGSTFSCQRDAEPAAACNSGTVTYPGLGAGPHTFTVTATDAAGNTDSSPATRTWTITKLTPVLTWANPADITYPTPLSGTQLNATADVGGSLAYTPASGTVLNAGDNQDLKVDFTPTDATNYSTVSKTVKINVKKADPVVTATGNTCTYNNSPCAGSGSAKGVLGEVLTPVNVAYKDALGNLLTSAPVNAGTYSVAARFAGNANYNQKQSAPATITITPASSTTTVTCSPTSVTYTGAAQTPCTASVIGAGGLSSSLPVSYANDVNAGTATASASWTGDANHAGSSGSKTFAISKANASCTVTGYSVTYDGSAHTATGACTGVLGESLSGGLNLGGTTHTNAGTYSDSWTFTDSTGNYNNASGTVSDSITQATGDGDYTGLLDYATASATTNTALVSSSAFVHVTTGDITTATVTFFSTGSPSFQSCTAKVGRISSSIGGDQTGSAACTWSGSVGNTGGQTYTVGFTVGGNYSYAGEAVNVNVRLPSLTNFITGGGYLVLTPNTVGIYAGDPGSKANFGANVKYNKSGTNLQGNVNIIVRQGATEYQFKSNSLIQLNVNATASPSYATFTSKASGQSWPKANPAAVTPLGGNWTIRLKMHDVAEPGAGKDTIGITVWDGSGALVFSSNWDTSATSPTTKEQVLGGGNLQVH